jgi:hypothetical protein
MTSECWGVYSHDLNNGKGKKYYYEAWFLYYDNGDCNGVRGVIDPFDPDNKYGPKNSADMVDLKDVDDPSNTLRTARTQATANESRLSHISQDGKHSVSEFDPNTTIFPTYNTLALGPMSSILTSKKMDTYHYEVPENDKALIFDEAIEELGEICAKIECAEITSMTFHVNSWGMSCSKYFAENAMVKMTKLTRLLWADTIKYKPRSDLCMSIAAMLFICKDHKIEYIDLSDNFMDHDGGKAFNEWMWTNSSLKVIKLTNTKVGKRTAELFLEAWEENKNLKIEEFYLSKNEFINEKSMKVFGKYFGLS